ncbi:MAG: 50S ribosomal protein L5 [Dehalococcoidia bacterium]|jgi:large subunit ribosomal protein L5
MARLKERYQQEILPALMKEFKYTSVMQAPRVVKVVINVGMGEAIQHAQSLDAAQQDIAAISGQHPVITKARKSIASFKLRKGMPIGVMVTLRGKRMYEFLDKLISVALPRIRDFQGLNRKAFDGMGNYTLGLKDQTIFPEISYEKVDKVRGLEICIITTASNDAEGLRLFELMGMPFSR